MSRARIGIVVYRTRDGGLDWRPCGVECPSALPGGAVLLEITWISDETDAADTIALHGFADDDYHTRAIVELRNAAITEMAEGGSW